MAKMYDEAKKRLGKPPVMVLEDEVEFNDVTLGIAVTSLFINEYGVYPSGERVLSGDEQTADFVAWAELYVEMFGEIGNAAEIKQKLIDQAVKGGCLFVDDTLIATGAPDFLREEFVNKRMRERGRG